MAKIERITITTDSGQEQEALAPVIISASRSTDIPAFYAQWFINRLNKGYCTWYNPFNQKPSYVSFANCKVVVFWTKNPKPLIPLLHELDQRGIHYYFQHTLNDYDQEQLEPNVPPLRDRIEVFKQLSDQIGKDKVIWRFDPMMICPEMGLTPRHLVEKVWHLGNAIKGYTEKLVFSFIDVDAYAKVQNNLVKRTQYFTKDNVLSAEPSIEQKVEIADYLTKCQKRWREQGWDLTLATCAEDIDLDAFGIEHNKCIDDELIKRSFSDDKALMHYVDYLELPKVSQSSLLGDLEIPFAQQPKRKPKIKDPGQRKICGCMVSKDIGMYNTCDHLCVYCYANTSITAVQNNKQKHNLDSESIIS